MNLNIKNICLIAVVTLFTACGDSSDLDNTNSGGSGNSGSHGSNQNSASIKEITPFISKLDLDGNSYGIELSNDKKTAYVANGVDGLAIVDVSNLKKPKVISSLQLGNRTARSGDNVVDIRISKDNQTAYLVGSDYGLYIVDISNINAPTLAGKFKTDGRARRVRLSKNEDIAYVAIGDRDEAKSGLSIINIANHSNPKRIGKYHAEDSVRGIAISRDDTKAFLTDYYEGVKIVDISNKTNPVLIRKFQVSNRKIDSIELSKDEKRLYVTGEDLAVVDISNINNIKILKRVLTPSGTHNITVTNDMLYLAPSVGIQFVNIENPKNAFREGSFSTPFYTQDIRVSADEKVAYLANGLDGLIIMDISKHKSPALISGGVKLTGELGGGAVLSKNGKIVYRAQGDAGLRIIDVSNPKTPRLISSFVREDIGADSVTLSSDNHYAYIIGRYKDVLDIVDITDPATPVLVGSYNYHTSKYLDSYSNNCTGIAISKDNKRAYLSIWEHGFIVVDIQDPSNPHDIAGLELSGQYSKTLVEGITVSKDSKKLFLSTSDGVLFLDISDLRKISIVGRNFYYNAGGAILSNDEKKMFVFVEDTMYIDDISDIKNPKRLSYLRDVGSSVVISKNNQRAYSLNRYRGLRVIDISNLNSPKIIGKMVLPGLPSGLSVSENEELAYFNTFQSGLTIMSLKDFK